MAINNSFSENVVSIEDEEIQQNEEEQTFEGTENPENVQRNLFDEFDEVASEEEEDDSSDDSSDGIIYDDLSRWNDINFSWDIDNVQSLIYGINLREDVTNLSITDKDILFIWQDMSFYFELTDDGLISMDIDIWVHQKFLFSMETENSEKRLIPIEHRRNVHQNEEYTVAIVDLFPHIDSNQFLN